MRRAPLLPLLALLLALVVVPGRGSGDSSGEPCVELPGYGCYAPPADAAGGDVGVLVYYRGYFGDYKGLVPDPLLTISARQAYSYYNLGEAAKARHLGLLVLGSSHLPLTSEALAAMAPKLGGKVGRLVLAAHSGGYVGLLKTDFASLPPVERVILLDNFYFDADSAATLQSSIGKTACLGYYTQQEGISWVGGAPYADNLHSNLEPVLSGCKIEAHDDYGHDDAVPACLKYYLAGAACPGTDVKNPPPPPPLIEKEQVAKKLDKVPVAFAAKGDPGDLPAGDAKAKTAPVSNRKWVSVPGSNKVLVQLPPRKKPLDQSSVPRLTEALYAQPQPDSSGANQRPRAAGCDWAR